MALKAESRYLNPYDRARDYFSAQTIKNPEKALYNDEDWTYHASNNDLDSYIGLLSGTNELGDVSEFKKKWNWDYLTDPKSRVLALYAEEKLKNDKTLVEHERYKTSSDGAYILDTEGNPIKEKYETTDYDYYYNLLQEQANIEIEKETKAFLQLKKDSMSDVAKFFNSIGAVLGTVGSAAVNQVEDIILVTTALVGGAVAAASKTMRFDDFFVKSIAAIKEDSLGKHWSDELTKFEIEATSLKDLDGNYTSWFAELSVGVADTIGKMLPTMAIPYLGQALDWSGKAIEFTSTMLMYTGFTGQDIKSIYDYYKHVDTSIPSYQIMGLAIAKSAAQVAIEKGLSIVIGKLTGGRFSTSLQDRLLGYQARGTGLSKSAEKLAAEGATTFFTKRFAADTAMSMFQEGIEEVLQDLSDAFITSSFSWLNDNFQSLSKEQGLEAINFRDLAMTFVISAATSLTTSAVNILKNLGHRVPVGIKEKVKKDKEGQETKVLKTKYMNIFGSIAYSTTLSEFVQNCDAVIEAARDIKPDSKEYNQFKKALAEVYGATRMLTSLYGEVGEETFKKCASYVDQINAYSEGPAINSGYYESTIKNIEEQIKLLPTKFILNESLKKELEEKLKKNNVSGQVKIYDREDEEVSDTKANVDQEEDEKEDRLKEVGINVLSEIDKALDQTVAYAEHADTAFEVGNKLIIVPKELIEKGEAGEIYTALAESHFVDELEKGTFVEDNEKFLGLISEFLKANGLTFDNRTILYNLLYSERNAFFEFLLYGTSELKESGTEQLQELLLNLMEATNRYKRDSLLDAFKLKKLNQVVDAMKKSFFDYYLATGKLDKASDIFTKDEMAELKKSSIFNQIKAKVLAGQEISKNERFVISNIINNSPLTQQIKERVNEYLLGGFASTDQKLGSFKLISQSYNIRFNLLYDGITYASNNTIGGRILNYFLKYNNLTIKDIVTNVENQENIKESFKTFTNDTFSLDFTEQGIDIKTDEGTIVGWSKNDFIVTDEDFFKNATSQKVMTRTSSEGILTPYISSSIDKKSQGLITISDILFNSQRFLDKKVQNKIINEYGSLNVFTAFTYINKDFATKGLNYAIGITNNNNFCIIETSELDNVFLKGEKEKLKNKFNLKKGKSEFALSSIVKPEYLPTTELKNAKLVIDTKTKNQGMAEFNPVTKTMTLYTSEFNNANEFAATFTHEFQHILQTAYGLAIGGDRLLYNAGFYDIENEKVSERLPKKALTDIMLDINKHVVESKDKKMFEPDKSGSYITYNNLLKLDSFLYGGLGGESQANGMIYYKVYPLTINEQLKTIRTAWGSSYNIDKTLVEFNGSENIVVNGIRTTKRMPLMWSNGRIVNVDLDNFVKNHNQITDFDFKKNPMAIIDNKGNIYSITNKEFTDSDSFNNKLNFPKILTIKEMDGIYTTQIELPENNTYKNSYDTIKALIDLFYTQGVAFQIKTPYTTVDSSVAQSSDELMDKVSRKMITETSTGLNPELSASMKKILEPSKEQKDLEKKHEIKKKQPRERTKKYGKLEDVGVAALTSFVKNNNLEDNFDNFSLPYLKKWLNDKKVSEVDDVLFEKINNTIFNNKNVKTFNDAKTLAENLETILVVYNSLGKINEENKSKFLNIKVLDENGNVDLKKIHSLHKKLADRNILVSLKNDITIPTNRIDSIMKNFDGSIKSLITIAKSLENQELKSIGEYKQTSTASDTKIDTKISQMLFYKDYEITKSIDKLRYSIFANVIMDYVNAKGNKTSRLLQAEQTKKRLLADTTMHKNIDSFFKETKAKFNNLNKSQRELANILYSDLKPVLKISDLSLQRQLIQRDISSIKQGILKKGGTLVDLHKIAPDYFNEKGEFIASRTGKTIKNLDKMYKDLELIRSQVTSEKRTKIEQLKEEVKELRKQTRKTEKELMEETAESLRTKQLYEAKIEHLTEKLEETEERLASEQIEKQTLVYSTKSGSKLKIPQAMKSMMSKYIKERTQKVNTTTTKATMTPKYFNYDGDIVVESTNDEYIVGSAKQFYELNKDAFNELTQEDVNQIVNFISNAKLYFQTSQEDLILSVMALTGYLLEKGKTVYGLDITNDQEQILREKFNQMSTLSGKILKMIQDIYKQVDPAKDYAQQTAKKLGVSYVGMKEDINNLIESCRKGNAEDIVKAQQTFYDNAAKNYSSKTSDDIKLDYDVDNFVNALKTEIKDDIDKSRGQLYGDVLLNNTDEQYRKSFKEAVDEVIDANDAGNKPRFDKAVTNLKSLSKEIYNANNKKSKTEKVLDTLLNWQRTMMLSGPNTWARNLSTNIMLMLGQKMKLSEGIGDKISKGLDKLLLRKDEKLKQREKFEETQYKIIGTQVTNDVKEFIKKNIIDTKLFDAISDGLTKQDVQMAAREGKSYDLAKMIKDGIEHRILTEHPYNKKIFDGFTKFVHNAMSDSPFIKRRFMYYLGKTLVEDKVDISSNTLTENVQNHIVEAYILAANEFMHKSNILIQFDNWLKGKSKTVYFLWKQIMPFAGASWNWFTDKLKYTPMGFVKSIVDYCKLEKISRERKAQREQGIITVSERFTKYLNTKDLGKGVIGTVGCLIGALLFISGAAGLDEKDDKYKLKFGNIYLDVTDLYGTSSLLSTLGMLSTIKDTKDFWKGVEKAADITFEDSLYTSFYNLFRYNNGAADFIESTFFNSLGMMLPNFFKVIAGSVNQYQLKYDSGALGKFEKLYGSVLPFVIPKKMNIYTGKPELVAANPVLTLFNKFSPIDVDVYNVSAIEQEAMSLGIKKSQITGDITIDGKEVRMSAAQQEKLNKYYGELNNKYLSKLMKSSIKYKVKMPNGTYKELTYSQMTAEQKKTVFERVMSKDSTFSKIYLLTSDNKYKYYASDSEYYELKQLGITKNVYRKTNKLEGFVKI